MAPTSPKPSPKAIAAFDVLAGAGAVPEPEPEEAGLEVEPEEGAVGVEAGALVPLWEPEAEAAVVADPVAETPMAPHCEAWRARAACRSAAVHCAIKQALASAWNCAEAQTHGASVKLQPFFWAAGWTQPRIQGLMPPGAEPEGVTAVLVELWATALAAKRASVKKDLENMIIVFKVVRSVGKQTKKALRGNLKVGRSFYAFLADAKK